MQLYGPGLNPIYNINTSICFSSKEIVPQNALITKKKKIEFLYELATKGGTR
jgi:hypothetical protein